jgi:hypothetical protein
MIEMLAPGRELGFEIKRGLRAGEDLLTLGLRERRRSVITA